MLVRSWINEDTGEVDDKKINMQEMEELHSEVKQLYAVRKQIKLMESTEQVKVRFLCLVEGKYVYKFSGVQIDHAANPQVSSYAHGPRI